MKTTITNRPLILRVVTVVIALMMIGAVSAQDTVPIGPIGSVEAGDFRALAVTADGQRLLIADAENDELRVYDFSDPSLPTLINSVDLEGEPLAVTAAEDFALVAVSTPDEGDAVRVIAPSRYSRTQGYIETNSIDVPDGVRQIVISPDNYWALALSANGYTLLELVSAGEINSLPTESQIVDAAVGGDTAFLLSESSLMTESLRVNLDVQRVEQIELEGVGQQIVINPRLTLGVITLEGNRLLMFNPSTLDTFSTFEAGGAAITDVQFVSGEEGEWLAVSREGGSEITLLDVNDPSNVGDLGSLSTLFESPVQAMTTYNELIIVTDGQTVRIFAP